MRSTAVKMEGWTKLKRRRECRVRSRKPTCRAAELSHDIRDSVPHATAEKAADLDPLVSLYSQRLSRTTATESNCDLPVQADLVDFRSELKRRTKSCRVLEKPKVED